MPKKQPNTLPEQEHQEALSKLWAKSEPRSAEWWLERCPELKPTSNGKQLSGPCILCGGETRFKVAPRENGSDDWVPHCWGGCQDKYGIGPSNWKRWILDIEARLGVVSSFDPSQIANKASHVDVFSRTRREWAGTHWLQCKGLRYPIGEQKAPHPGTKWSSPEAKAKLDWEGVEAIARQGMQEFVIGIIPASGQCMTVDIDSYCEDPSSIIEVLSEKFKAKPFLVHKTLTPGHYLAWWKVDWRHDQSVTSWSMQKAENGEWKFGTKNEIDVKIRDNEKLYVKKLKEGKKPEVELQHIQEDGTVAAAWGEIAYSHRQCIAWSLHLDESGKAYPIGQMGKNPFELATGADILTEKAFEDFYYTNGGENSTPGTVAGEPRFITPDQAGLQAAFATLGWEVRYNSRSESPEVKWHGADYRKVSETGFTERMQEIVASHFRFVTRRGELAPAKFNEQDWRRIMLSICFDRQHDPLIEYFDSLEPWDGQDRFSGCLSNNYRVPVEDIPLCRWVEGFLWKGTVARALYPGCNLQESPVLVGSFLGDDGKSIFCRNMFPRELLSLFSDNFDLNRPGKEKAEDMLGKAIIEVGEMAGSTRAEADKAKSFMSSTTAHCRLAYRRDAEDFQRRCIFIGTANSGGFLLKDQALFRRYACVRTGHKDIPAMLKWLNTNRRQLWAQAVHEIKALKDVDEVELKVAVPKELKEALRASARRQASDPNPALSSMIEERLAPLPPRENGYAMHDLLLALCGNEETTDEQLMRMSKESKAIARDLLHIHGWVNKQKSIAGRVRRIWLPPETNQPKQAESA